MRKNLLKEKFAAGGNAVGITMHEPSLQIIEVLGILGFDYINIDCQHSPLSVETALQMIRTAELRGITPLVRVPQNVTEVILRYLDAGAMGIFAADMNSGEEARKVVKAVKYPPQGDRGLGPVRTADFGLKEPLAEYVKTANAETLVLGVLESKEGVDNIEEILGTEGLDGVIIGTNDLSKSLGVPGQTTHPLVQNAVDKILAVGKRTGKVIGGPVRKGETPKQYYERGFRFASIGLIPLVAGAARQVLENARS
jgi:4-hydroxy-2-oxoheptanedioate aldolase